MKQLHAFVSGRVQGVFFRASTCDEGRRLGLVGWARNLPDGRVEVVAQGAQAALQAFITYLHQGPAAARVDEVELRWDEPDAGLHDFGVRY
ncbi:MAG: acylphosphatase [Nitrospirota bacterium]|jgi:acylphosphatase